MTRLVRLGIRVRGATAEAALADLAPVLAAGAEEVDLPGGAVEYAVYGRPEELPDDTELAALAGAALVSVERTAVAAGWETAFHAYVPRAEVPGVPFAVRPPWVDGEADDLVIDPGTAFGAATHPSTRLALRLLAFGAAPLGSLVDWGTGTGILAIAGARLGYCAVRATDLSGGELVLANAARNGVSVAFAVDDVTTRAPHTECHLDRGYDGKGGARRETVVANLPIDVQLAAARVQPRPPRLLLAGVLEDRLEELAAAWAPLREVRRIAEDGWGALELVAA